MIFFPIKSWDALCFKYPIVSGKPEILTIYISLQMKNVERPCKQDSWTAAFDCLLYRNLQDVDESYVYKNIWISFLKKSGFYFVLRVWRLGQNWAGKDGKKKKEEELEYTRMTYLKKLNWKKQ